MPHEPELISATPQTGTRRVGFLDGLRGVASLIVVFYHILILGVGWDRAHQLIRWTGPFLNGTYSVSVFFVLSGFVLSQSAAGRKTALAAEVAARYLRLTVPMTASLLFACLLHRYFLPPASQEGFTYVQAWTDGLWRVYRTGHSQINDVVWTMRIEFLGSLAIYFIYHFSPPRWRVAVLSLFALAALADPLYLGFPAGGLIREAWSRHYLRGARWAWLTLSLALLLNLAGDRLGFHGYCLSATLLVVSLFLWAPLGRFFECAPFRFLGRISFCLYLLHASILACLAPRVPETGAAGTRIFLLALEGLPLALGCAWLLTIALDEPMIRSLHRLKSRFRLPGKSPGEPKPAADR